MTLRVRFFGAGLGEFFQKLALSGCQIDRRFDLNLNVEVAALAASHARHAFALEAKAPACLRAGRQRDTRTVAVDCRDFNLPAQSCSAHGRKGLAIEVGPIALKQRMRTDRQEEVE